MACSITICMNPLISQKPSLGFQFPFSSRSSMADHYTILGLTKNATNDEIKHAFRRLAMQFHPDKHAQSPKSVRDSASRKFKQVSEAYDVLIDARKRSDYDFSNNGGRYYSHTRTTGGCNYDKSSSYYPASYSDPNRGGSMWVFRVMATHTFVRNVAFAGLFICGTVAFSMSGETLWTMHNPGKSFEEAMESIEKKKEPKDEK